jgi:hypothetical protein
MWMKTDSFRTVNSSGVGHEIEIWEDVPPITGSVVNGSFRANETGPIKRVLRHKETGSPICHLGRERFEVMQTKEILTKER